MINNTQILDSGLPLGKAQYSRGYAGKRKSAVTALLERLGICRSPRILNAVCLADKASSKA